jgi:hypothetical protein
MDLKERKPTRLKEYDYSAEGAYFLTICVQDKKNLLSKINVGDGVLDVPKKRYTRLCLVMITKDLLSFHVFSSLRQPC